MLKRSPLVLVLVAFGLVQLLTIFYNPHTVYAAQSGAWVDRTSIKVGNDIYVDQDPFDPTHQYVHDVLKDCSSKIDINNFDGSGTSGHIVTKKTNSVGECIDGVSDTINLDHPSNRLVTAYKISDDTVFMPAYIHTSNVLGAPVRTSLNAYFKLWPLDAKESDPDIYAYYADGKYVPYKGGGSQRVAYSRKVEETQRCTYVGCETFHAPAIFSNNGQITQPDSQAYGSVTPSGGGGTGPGGSAVDVAHIDCQTGGSSFIVDAAINWLLCPLVDGAQAIVKNVGAWVVQQLEVNKCLFAHPTIEGDCNENENVSATHIYNAWNTFRLMSLSLLVLIGLIAVVSQALGFEFIDAYTIRKVLPRMVIAVVAISISWQLMFLAIQLTNASGVAIRAMIFAPFGDLRNAQVNPTLLFGSAGLAGGLLSTMGLLSFIGTAALAVIIAFLFTVLRLVAIMALVIFAPVAILSSILPGTQKLWKLWHEGLSGALIMYPIVIAFITVGSAFGKILGTLQPGSGATGVVYGAMAIVATYAPFFLIPKAFSLAGGLVGNLSGMVNDRGRGAFDRLKKYRQGQVATNAAKLKAGNRFEGKSWIPGSRGLARGFNRTSVGLGTGFKGGFGIGERGRQAVDQTRRLAMNDIMKSPEWNGINQNDDALMAATYDSAGQAEQALTARWGGNAEAAERARRAVRAVQTSTGFGRPQAILAAQQLVSTGTGYNNLQDMTQTLARAAGGNENTARSLAGFANADTKQRGRFDLAPSYGTLDGLVRNEMSGNGGANNYDTALRQSWNSAGLYQLASGKGQATQQFADHFLDRLQHGNQVEKRDAGIALMEMQNMLPSANGDNQQIINNTMFRLRNEAGQRLGLDFDAGMSVEDQIAAVATHAANGQPAVDFQGRQLSGATIRGQARVYDREAVDPNRLSPPQPPTEP